MEANACAAQFLTTCEKLPKRELTVEQNVSTEIASDARKLIGMPTDVYFALIAGVGGECKHVPNLSVSDYFSGKRYVVSDSRGVVEYDGRHCKIALDESQKKSDSSR